VLMMTVIKMDRHSTLLSILFFYGYNNQKEGRNKEPNPFSFYRYFLNFLFFEIISGSVFICLKKREYLHFSINWTFFLNLVSRALWDLIGTFCIFRNQFNCFARRALFVTSLNVPIAGCVGFLRVIFLKVFVDYFVASQTAMNFISFYF